jgi:hypothetical protein
MALTIAVAQKNSSNDNVYDNLNNGYLRIYSGTRPTNPDTALSGNTLLAELRFSATAFGASSGGVKTANAITQGTAAATGTASFFRALKSDGSTAVIDGTVGTSGTDAIIGNTSIVSNEPVTCSSFVITAGG